MNARRPNPSDPRSHRSTWVVLCPTPDGPPRSEYVEGTELVTDGAGGVLRILDGGQVVREYASGAWSTFCEWVNVYSDFLHGTVFRLPLPTEQRPPGEAERLLAGVMQMDPHEALQMLGRSLSRGTTSSEPAGVVLAPTRLPGPRHA